VPQPKQPVKPAIAGETRDYPKIASFEREPVNDMYITPEIAAGSFGIQKGTTSKQNGDYLPIEELIQIRDLNQDNSINPNAFGGLNKEISGLYKNNYGSTQIGDENILPIGGGYQNVAGKSDVDVDIQRQEVNLPSESVYGKTPQLKVLQLPDEDREAVLKAEQIYKQVNGISDEDFNAIKQQRDIQNSATMNGESFDPSMFAQEEQATPKDKTLLSWAGSLLPTFFSGAYSTIGNSVGFVRDIPAMLGQSIGLNVRTPNASDFQRDMFELSQHLDEIAGADQTPITEKFKKGDYLGVVSGVATDIVKIMPAIIASSYMGGAGIPFFGALGAEEKYDSLKMNNNVGDQAKALNSTLTGTISGLTMYLALNKLPKLLPYAGGLVGKYGMQNAKTELSNAIYGGLALSLKHSGVLFTPVAMSVQGMTDKFASNVIDFKTGVTNNDDFSEGVAEAGWHGAAMGFGFAGTHALKAIPAVRMANERFRQTEDVLRQKMTENGLKENEINQVLTLLRNTPEKDMQSTIDFLSGKMATGEASIKQNQQLFENYLKSYNQYRSISYKFDKEATVEGIKMKKYLAENPLLDLNMKDVSKEQRRLEEFNRTIQQAELEAENNINQYINPDTGTLLTLNVNGVPQQIVKGKPVYREDGTIDREKSDQQFVYIDENGETQITSIEFVDDMVEDIPAPEAIEAAKQAAKAPIQAKFDNEQVRPYEANEDVRIQTANGQFVMGTIVGMQDGLYLFDDGSGQQPAKIEPRQIMNEDNIQGLFGGEEVIANVDGQEIKGAITFEPSIRTQGLVLVNGQPVPVESIKKIEETPENEGNTSVISDDMTETAPVQPENAPVTEMATTPAYPTNKKGEIDFDNMTVEQTFNYLKETEGEDVALEGLTLSKKAIQKRISDNIRAVEKFNKDKYAELQKATPIQEQAKIRTKHKATAQKLTDERAVLDAQLAEIRALMPQAEQAPAQPEVKPVTRSNVRPEEQLRREQEAKAQEEKKTPELSIEEKKADIERRREEELKFIYSGHIPIINFKTNDPILATETLSGDDAEWAENSIERKIKAAIKQGLDAETVFMQINAEGYTFNAGDDMETFRKYLNDRLNGKTNQPFNEFRRNPKKEINERYDAELAALEAAPETKPLNFRKVTKSVTRLNPYHRRLQNLGDYMGVEDYILRQIATGLTFKWESEGTNKGLGEELGLLKSTEEREWRKSILSNDGLTPQALAHSIWQDFGEDNNVIPGLNQMDYNDILNTVLEVVGGVQNKMDALKQAEKLHSKFDLSQEDYGVYQSFTPEEENFLENIPDDILESYLGITNFTAEQLDFITNLQNEYYAINTEPANSGTSERNQGLESETAETSGAEEVSSSEKPNKSNQSEQPLEKVKGITVINEEDNGKTLIYGTKSVQTKLSVKKYTAQEIKEELYFETKKRNDALAELQENEKLLSRTPIGKDYEVLKKLISDNKKLIESTKVTIPWLEQKLKEATEKQSSGNKLPEQAKQPWEMTREEWNKNVFIIPVRVGYGKSGTAKSGDINVQINNSQSDKPITDLNKAAQRIINDNPIIEVNKETIVRQLLDAYKFQKKGIKELVNGNVRVILHDSETTPNTIATNHKLAIQQALSEGKPVPENVLKDYPELEVKPEVKNEPKKEIKTPKTESITRVGS